MTRNNMMWFVAVLLAIGLSPVFAAEETPAMDHSQMDHSQMDHGDMKQDSHATTSPAASGSHGSHASMQGGSPPPDARDPHAYSNGLRFGPDRQLHMMDEQNHFTFLVDRLEWVRSNGSDSGAYEMEARYGGDYNRMVITSEGHAAKGALEEGRSELLWSHALAAYWDSRLGVRLDHGVGPERGWLAFGLKGLAPYWFEIDASLYAGDQGRTAARLEADYELLITQRLVLQPRVEVNAYGQRDVERGIGAGLSEFSAGIRLRYEIRREFAPYVGIEWAGKYGGTARAARAAGEDPSAWRFVAGLRFWY